MRVEVKTGWRKSFWGIIFAYSSWSNIFPHPCFQNCQGMLRRLYFTWDQLTDPYLNAHSAWAAQQGGRSWFFLWPFLVEVGWSLGNDIVSKIEPQSNQADSHSSISIKSLLQCHHNTNQNCNLSAMFRNHGFGSTIGYCVDLLWLIVYSKNTGSKIGAQEAPSYPQVDESAVAASKSSSLASKWRIKEGEFVKDRFWKSMRRVSHGQKVKIEWIT